jgi:alanine racemase
MAVIKANAYGHGMLRVARCLDDADCLAVARLAEAAALREAGIDTPIALLGGVVSESDLAQALEMDLQLGLHNESQIAWLERSAAANAIVWLKIDTGMNRLGFRLRETPNLIDRLQACTAVGELRLMTHFANADDEQDDRTKTQLAEFESFVSQFGGAVSVANSAAILGWADDLASFTEGRDSGSVWVRPGLSLYGVSPFADRCGAELGLRPAMQFESRLIAVKSLAGGEAVGYGGTWRTERDTMLGIVAAGYGDGYSRFIPAGSPVLVNGRRVPVAGLVSMDLTAIDLGPGSSDRIGDPVLLWGEGLPVEEIARNAATIPYQLLCGVTNREAAAFED